MFVLEIEFALVVRSETVDGLEALLEWLKKVFLSVLPNLEVITMMPCITSDIDPLSSLSFHPLITKPIYNQTYKLYFLCRI